MNFILHKHQSKNHIVTEPNGLRELMSDISREVLREQPKNINLFIADYLDAMIITREHAISKKFIFFIFLILIIIFF